jgi:S1-C subfamily serine protease
VTVSDVEASTPAPPARRPRRPPWLVVGALAAVVAILAVVTTRWWSGDSQPSTSSPSTIGAPLATALDDAVGKAVAAQSQVVARVFAKIQPSVVEINVARDDVTPTTGPDESAGLGTGVVVNQDGTILTADHVVDGATSIEVVYSDGTRSKAEVTAADKARDIAVLRPATLPSVVVPAVLGSAGVGVGLPVVAVGNPLGLDDTTTAGVISALDRAIRADDGSRHTGLIQFDAAVNPGSSGGPLLNQGGEVIGVVVALADPSRAGFFIGIGFAVPIAQALATGGGDQPPK